MIHAKHMFGATKGLVKAILYSNFMCNSVKQHSGILKMLKMFSTDLRFRQHGTQEVFFFLASVFLACFFYRETGLAVY